MTGANSRLPTLVYQNLSSANPLDGTTEHSVDLTRTIQHTVSFASLALTSKNDKPIRIVPTANDVPINSIEPELLDFDDEDGEDLTLFWEGLHHCQWIYGRIQDNIQTHLSYSPAPLLDRLTVEDLLEWLYPNVSHQLCEYLTFQEEE